jgi:ribonuclease HI
MITIYTDGSARGNPGPGGWGAIVASDERVIEMGGSEAYTTNNKMELTACIRSLEFVTANADFQDQPVEIYTDSEYVLKGITVWIHGWIEKGWRTAAKKPVLNQELWQELLSATLGKNISWKLVRGHFGVAANERCDEIATLFADKLDPALYDGTRESYKVSLKEERGQYSN